MGLAIMRDRDAWLFESSVAFATENKTDPFMVGLVGLEVKLMVGMLAWLQDYLVLASLQRTNIFGILVH